HVRSDQRRSRAEKRIVDRCAAFGVIQYGPAHQIHWFLCRVTRGAFLVVPPERIQVSYLPDCGLCAVSSPVGATSFAHRIPAWLVLPVIRPTAQRKMLLRPDNLSAQLESCSPDTSGHFGRMHARVPDIDHVAWKQLVSWRPVGSVVIPYGPGLPLVSQPRLFPPIGGVLHPVAR